MPLLRPDERRVLEAVAGLTYCNPFLEERIELERRALGDAFRPIDEVWHPRVDVPDDNPNVVRIAERARGLVESLRERIAGGARADADELDLYRDACLYAVYYGFHQQLFALVRKPPRGDAARRAPYWPALRDELHGLLELPGVGLPEGQSAAHIHACFFQVRRAFHFIFRSIAGGSLPAARLRARVWQSIFTHDLRRYQRALFGRMGQVTTLIDGPSGAGKELVARAIGLSRYIPFDEPSGTFRERFDESFYPLNLAALSPTLIESELFGHRRGAFTGAVADRDGWLAVCPPLGTVFLDEIGEVDGAIQVKLLRVLESRVFQPLGSTESLEFRGKIVAATNRELAREIAEGRFRTDLYYRLCADTIRAPSLAERIADSPAELQALLAVLAERLVGPDEAPRLAGEAERWIDANLGRDHDWPGNVRELAQCVSNVLIHRDYEPPRTGGAAADPAAALVRDVRDARLDAESLLAAYCTLVYERSGSWVEAARRLGLDRRTVKAHVTRAR